MMNINLTDIEKPGNGAKIRQHIYLSTSATNGIGPAALLQTLVEHYKNLSATYRSKQMLFEAELFRRGADELEALVQRHK